MCIISPIGSNELISDYVHSDEPLFGFTLVLPQVWSVLLQYLPFLPRTDSLHIHAILEDQISTLKIKIIKLQNLWIIGFPLANAQKQSKA